MRSLILRTGFALVAVALANASDANGQCQNGQCQTAPRFVVRVAAPVVRTRPAAYVAEKYAELRERVALGERFVIGFRVSAADLDVVPGTWHPTAAAVLCPDAPEEIKAGVYVCYRDRTGPVMERFEQVPVPTPAEDPLKLQCPCTASNCTCPKAPPPAAVRVAQPARVVQFNPTHTCPSCGRQQYEVAGFRGDGRHNHTCPGCGTTWFH